jgi:hypothetical protein
MGIPVPVSPKEAQIIECIRIGLKPRDIWERLSTSRGTLYLAIDRLKYQKLIIQSEYACYRVLEPVEYEIISDPYKLGRMRRSKTFDIRMAETLQPQFKKIVTAEIKHEIRRCLEENREMKRKQLARQIGLPRYLLNQTVISMGLEQKDTWKEGDDDAADLQSM